MFASIPGAYNTYKDQAAAFDSKKAVFKPFYFNTTLVGFGTSSGEPTLEFTATSHGAVMRVRFPPYVNDIYDSGFQQNRRISIILDGGDDSRGYDHSEVLRMSDDGAFSIQGYSKANFGGVPSNFAHYFVAAIYVGEEGTSTGYNGVFNFTSSNEGAAIDFDGTLPENEVITVRIATSFISIDQAITNLRSELPLNRSFDDIVLDGKREWNSVLSRVDIQDIHDDYSDAQKKDLLTSFYSSLYRASLFPRQLTETSASGEQVHWSPYDAEGRVFHGPLSTDSGFWDAFSTVCECN